MNSSIRSLALAAALTLGGCNILLSPTPMLTADKAAAPPHGLYLAIDSECPVDTKGPASAWPQCAKWLVVNADGTMTLGDDLGDDPKLQGMEVVFAAGNPTLAQFKLEKPSDKERIGYIFFGYEPDPERPIAGPPQYKAWPVKCGPRDNVQYPGIEPDCVPRNLDQVRSAANASRAENVTVLRWVRSPGPGDEPRK